MNLASQTTSTQQLGICLLVQFHQLAKRIREIDKTEERPRALKKIMFIIDYVLSIDSDFTLLKDPNGEMLFCLFINELKYSMKALM